MFRNMSALARYADRQRRAKKQVDITGVSCSNKSSYYAINTYIHLIK